MVGLLIVTHCDLGKELLKAAEFIVGGIEAADTVSIHQSTGCEELREIIKGKIESLDRGQGVLILTDMFGGTPSNLSLSFLRKETVEVLTGVNLPMIIAIVQGRSQLKLAELAERAQRAAVKGVSLAGKLLEAG